MRPNSARGGAGPARRRHSAEVYQRRRLTVGGVAALVLMGLIWVATRGGTSQLETVSVVAAQPDVAAANVTPTAPVPAADASATAQPEVNLAALDGIACSINVREVKRGDTGDDVKCAQTALAATGVYAGELSGTFDDATHEAAKRFQETVGVYVDGIIGQKTASELGIWPGEEAFIVRTPAPAPGAKDLWGVPLSSVASAGDDAPPLPDDAGQGTGKRVVYERSSQRVWAIDDQERIVRSYLVSGSRYRNEVPGVHQVYSKTERALGWDLKANLPYMIRYVKTERGAIGFHAIPSWIASGEKLQTEDELGQKLSGGCTRQAPLDAQFLWAFADVGTTVIVL